MNVLLSFVLSMLFVTQDVLPVDENGAITYYEVVELPGYPETILFENAKSYLKSFSVRGSKKKYMSIDPDEQTVFNKGSYGLSNMLSLGKHVDGIVMFDMLVEIKEGKYRYIINNFVFQEFERDRYGKYVPVKGSKRPLEAQVSKLSRKQWEIHQKNTHKKIEGLINDFKMSMASTEQSRNKKGKKTRIEDDW